MHTGLSSHGPATRIKVPRHVGGRLTDRLDLDSWHIALLI